MKVLCVGGGGREHAIVKVLEKSGADIYVVMKNKNPGIARAAEEFLLESETNIGKIVDWAAGKGIELAVIGPEAPLGAGIVDALESKGIRCAGPNQEAAQIEISKEFARNLMRKYKIPGLVDYWIFDTLKETKRFVEHSDFEMVVKPVGLTGGKGVKVWGDHLKSKKDVIAYAEEILEKQIGGSAKFLIEKKEVGEEFSLQAFSDGKNIAPMPLVQDYKRLLEGDGGPNTGGMGSFSDANHLMPFIEKKDYEVALDIMRKTVQAMHAEGRPFKGILYGAFIATVDSTMNLEFNARFADPEGMNVLPILDTDFAEICMEIADGNLSTKKVGFKNMATVCKYVVPQGYGSRPQAGEPVEVNEKAIAENRAELYYAAVNESEGKITTTTSRTLAVLGIADNIEKAFDIAESSLKHVKGNVFMRHDIGRKDYIQKKIDRMKALRKRS
jgi:phosphoribosylamine--glycine ligase